MQSTRFDIEFSVFQVARHKSRANIHHSAAVNRVVRYLKEKTDLPITYSTSNKSLDQKSYCYSLHGNYGIQGKMRSTTDTMSLLADGLVRFSPSLQLITATSTTEAKQVVYLFHLLREFRWSYIEPATFYSNSQGALYLSSKANYSSSRKHVKIRLFNLRDMIRTGQVRINHVLSGHQLSDILTKFCNKIVHQIRLKAVAKFGKYPVSSGQNIHLK